LIDGYNLNDLEIFNYIKTIDINLNDKMTWNEQYNYLLEINSSIKLFLDNNKDKFKSIKKNCLIDVNNLKDIRIKLCDFNLVLDLKKNINKRLQIQTRYYRAPEIILGVGLHRKSDYWSIGCLLYELITGDILFNPDKTSNINRDTCHVMLIEQLCGKISTDLINKGKFHDLIFNKDNSYRNYEGSELKFISLNKLLITTKKNTINENILNNLGDLLNSILNVEPENRSELNIILDKICEIKNLM